MKKGMNMKVYRSLVYLSLPAIFGFGFIPASVLGGGGYYVKSSTVSTKSTLTGVVADDSAPYADSYWMNQSGEIWSGGNGDPGVSIAGEKIFDGLDENDDWQYLAKGSVEGIESFIMFNDTEDKVYIRNASTDSLWA